MRSPRSPALPTGIAGERGSRKLSGQGFDDRKAPVLSNHALGFGILVVWRDQEAGWMGPHGFVLGNADMKQCRAVPVAALAVELELVRTVGSQCAVPAHNLLVRVADG